MPQTASNLHKFADTNLPGVTAIRWTKEAADAAHEKFRNACAKLTGVNPLDSVPDSLLAKLEESGHMMKLREEKHQEQRRELTRLWNVNAYLLAGAASYLDELKRLKQ